MESNQDISQAGELTDNQKSIFEYLARYELQEHMEKCLSDLISAQVENPYQYISDYFAKLTTTTTTDTTTTTNTEDSAVADGTANTSADNDATMKDEVQEPVTEVSNTTETTEATETAVDVTAPEAKEETPATE